MDPTHNRSLYNDSGFPHAACQAVVLAGNGFNYGGSYLEGHEMTTDHCVDSLRCLSSPCVTHA